MLHFTRNTAERVDTPGERFPPLDIDSRDVRAAPLPFCLPNSAAIERRTVQVRASQRVELRACEVQRRPELVGRRERVEVRRVDEGVVAANERREILRWSLWTRFKGGWGREKKGRKHKGYFTFLGLRSNGSRCIR